MVLILIYIPSLLFFCSCTVHGTMNLYLGFIYHYLLLCNSGALNKGRNNIFLLFFIISAGKNTAWIGLTTAHSWETLVIFGVNFKELNVHMNMGNVMGNVDWISKDFKSEGRLSIGSTGHKNMLISVGLSGSKLEAKAGTYNLPPGRLSLRIICCYHPIF